MALLDVRDLKIAFYDTTPPTEVVKGISFSLEEGETLGIVGESGSGKTQTALSILHLLKENSAVSGGEILYEDSSVAHASSQDLQRIRGKEISMIFPGADDLFKSGSDHRRTDYRGTADS